MYRSNLRRDISHEGRRRSDGRRERPKSGTDRSSVGWDRSGVKWYRCPNGIKWTQILRDQSQLRRSDWRRVGSHAR